MIGAVVLAAGESKRMGEPKLLVEIRGKPMVEWVIDSFKRAVEDIVVVLGHRPEVVRPAIEKLGARWVVNENYAEGMVSSFKRGLDELKHCDAVFLALGDQPFVDRDFLLKAIDAWRGGAKIVSPVHKGKKGHPVLFDRSLFDEILFLEKQEMIRDVIHRHESEHHLVEAGEWAIIDIDTPETLGRLNLNSGSSSP
jgi:molybdenum cofactor cytidylyltransferase